MKSKFFAFVLILCLVFTAFAHGEGLLPSLTETIGTAMPSIGDVIHRYPDNEETDNNGNVVEVFENVTEEEFNAYSEYLADKGATLNDYQVSGDHFEATVSIDGVSIMFEYDYKGQKARVVYPKGTYDERVENAKTRFKSFVSLFESGLFDEANAEVQNIEDASMYMPLMDYLKTNEINSIDEYYTEVTYRQAGVLNESDSIVQAYRLYQTIKDYKDVSEILSTDPRMKAVSSYLKKYSVGTTMTYGKYQSETVQWIIIGEDEDKRLLLSSKAIDAMKYGRGPYASSDIRDYVINTIYETAFSSEEKESIVADDETGDPMFLLSAEEVREYNVTNYLCSHTSYASKRGIRMGRNYCWWGLRTVLSNGCWGYCCQDIVYTYVDSKGEGGTRSECLGIRPAIWINISDMLPEDINEYHIVDEAEESNAPDADTSSDNAVDEQIENVIVMEKGSKGDDVKRLQQALIDQGFWTGKADGQFGKMTEAAVRAAQEAFGMEPTGKVDTLLLDKLYN